MWRQGQDVDHELVRRTWLKDELQHYMVLGVSHRYPGVFTSGCPTENQQAYW